MSNASEVENLVLNKKAIIFDFDGVILDSVDIKTRAFSDLFQNFGPKIQNKVINHHLANGGVSRHRKISHYYNEFLNKKLNKFELNKLCDDFSKLVVSKVISSSEIKGASNFLQKLNKIKKFMFINTGTPQDEINLILKERNLYNFFNKVYGSPSSKEKNMKSILNENNLDISDCIFFGDSFSDLIAADKFEMDFVGVGSTIRKFLENREHFNILSFNEIKL